MLIIYAKVDLVKVSSSLIDSKINRTSYRVLNTVLIKYVTSAAVVDRKSVTVMDTQLDDYVTS